MKAGLHHRHCLTRTAGFSLVEVTMAIGIMSFCLVSILGLFGVGLDAVRTSRDAAGAGACLERLSAAVRNAELDASGTYRVEPAYSELDWSLGSPKRVTLENLSLSGAPDSAASGPRLVAHVEVNPPASAMGSGSVFISIAWPATATWNSGSSTWENANGSLDSWVVLLP